MTAQFRASDEDWQTIKRFTGDESQVAYRCIRELRDRVMCMDACIRDIYTQIDELKKRCDNNYIKAAWIEDRVEKLEQPVSTPEQLPKSGLDLGTSVLAGADGPAPDPLAGGLVDEVADAIAVTAVLAVADWVERNIPISGRSFAQRLRREVGG